MTQSELVGQVLDDKYSIERPLGKGGMGTVYLATHIGTGRPVAVKVIAPDFMQRAEFVERFRREAQAAGRLRHPNVVDVTDFGFSATTIGSEVAYLVMEYLDGCTLGEILDEEKQLPVAWSIDIIEQVCSAVEEAHKQGIIHRDLKPDNIWLEPNQRGGYTVKVLDFGIAKLEEARIPDAKPEDGTEFESGISTVVAGGKDTISDQNDGETLVDQKDLTSIQEGETLALDSGEESQEGSPQVSREVVPSESGTAIMNPSAEVSDPEIGDKQTVVIGTPSTNRSLQSISPTANLTRMGAVLGTPLYMSPEQCRGEKLTPGSDIYSLAVIVYQLFAGRTPFEGDYVTVMEGHKSELPPPIDGKKVKKRLRGTVMNALAKLPEDRPESAEAFANKLRANSEGLAAILKRGFVMYAEHLSKFVLLAVIAFLPLILITFLRVGVNFFMVANEGASILLSVLSGSLSFISFFLQFVSTAVLVGMTTWVVGQLIAYPLRRINLWAAFSEVGSRIKSLFWPVIFSNLAATIGLVFLFVPGVWLFARYMLIAPSIMMEGVRGRAAFRRSAELAKRSFRTVFGAALLIYIVPGLLAVSVGMTINSVIHNFEQSAEIERLRQEIAQAPDKAESGVTKKNESDDSINFRIGSRGVVIGDEEKGMADGLKVSLREGLFELLWTPIAILLTSFTAVLSALIYFKTRQAGGESMQELLGKLNSSNSPQTKWQERVNRRLIQSGRISSGSGTT